MDFTNEQLKAIEHVNGPFMVLASPGSGKTSVIVNHTRYLIENAGVHPANILVITFTKAAAVEMRERFDKMMQGEKAPVTFGTFHAVFFSVLRSVYGYTTANIINDDLKRRIVRELCINEQIEISTENDYVNEVLSEISYVKGDMIPLDAYYSTSCSAEVFKRIYEGYESERKKRRLIDFDDMQSDCYKLFKEREDILKAYQARYKYILIDEFQDINRVQYDIVKMLAKPEDNIFIVGDDDQSIYRFRGAKPEIMLNFTKDYSDAKMTTLGINYRSSSEIVKASEQLIINNLKRYPKEVSSNMGAVEPVHLLKKDNEFEEHNDIIDKIRDYNSKGMLYQDMAVLFRSNIESQLLTEKLMKYNIPFKLKDMAFNIYEHWLSKNIISYIKMALGDMSRANFLTIMNKPNRYISRSLLDKPTVDLEDLKIKLASKDWMVERIEKMSADIVFISRCTPYAAINFIRQAVGYDDYLYEYSKERNLDLEEFKEILDTIEERAKDYKTFSEWFDYIEDYKVKLNESKKRDDKRDAVLLSTMHGSKGLEFDTVFIINANEGYTPHKKAIKDAELEEERRMFYVAMTRAKRHLYIYTLEKIFNKKLEPSRFVGEISFDRRSLSIGAVVEHKKFGRGVVTFQNSEKISIHFNRDDETRTFKIDYCVGNGYLKIVEE
ncbi:MAG: ATP-dependent helicase [Lachnospiraceae bacterium]|nr:ATP-dependent helicase [Lachnospiraceae bacterium]